MPRKSRMLCNSGIYHIMLRGNERKNIFIDEEDRLRFIDTLQEKKKLSEYFLYAYCLMDNHVHLVVRENKDGLHRIMKRINTSYAYYFNKKYKRVGHVFQDRFKSQCIESDGQLLTVINYVHNNPVKANMVKIADDFKWSSYNLIAQNNKNGICLVERNEILELFSPDENKARKLFSKYSNDDYGYAFIDINEEKKSEINEENVFEYVEMYFKRENLSRESLKDQKVIEYRDTLIKEIRDKSNLSIRRIAEILSINRGIVQRVCVSKEPSVRQAKCVR